LNNEIKIFSSPNELATGFAKELAGMIIKSAAAKRYFTIALSGGGTPKLLFSELAERFSDSVPWEIVHFFWGDERCVLPEDHESNFGLAKIIFLDKIKIPESNIHRIMGEMDPLEETARYTGEIACFTREDGGLPVFDLIILGLGVDGHTASIFPGNNKSFISGKTCELVVHPLSFQKRITITGSVINNSENIVFLVTGGNKAEVVSVIIGKKGITDYPAAHIKPKTGVLKWYLDSEAANLLGN
jgi:6-phosphogluconolactonase